MNTSDKSTRRKKMKSAAAARTEQEQDRQRVLECGMTDAEADCWELVARAAGAFFQLPDLHPMDDHEVTQAIHVVQGKLLSRPTYRKYLALAKGGRSPAR
jgi:hypothetical protein